MTRALATVAALFLFATAGCSHSIGDSCTLNSDCSPLGDRFCDIAQPGGYCTIEGCDVRMNSSGNLVDSCTSTASESVCVRFFSPVASEPCNPGPPEQSTCATAERCLCNQDDPTQPGLCLSTPLDVTVATDGGMIVFRGHCTPEASERRWCMKQCGSDSDCRASYFCSPTGKNGAEPVPRRLADFTVLDGGRIVASPDGGTFSVGVGDPIRFCVEQ